MSRMLRYVTFTLLAAAVLVALSASADTPRRHWWRPLPEARFRVSLEDRSGRPLRTFRHGGSTFVLGEPGQAYVIRVQNLTPDRVEAVVSVDGRDAVSGEVADFVRHRGYLVPAFGTVTIDGFRQSLDEVATFRFTDPDDSYSSRMGTPENVGIVGVAFFTERPRPVVVQPPRRWRDVPRADAAPRSAPRSAGKSRAAPGSGAAPRDEAAEGNLGTQYGESRFSPASTVPFQRATPSSPSSLVTLRYDDVEGLEARGIEVFPRQRRRVVLEGPQAFPGSGDLRFAPPPP